MVLLVSDSEGFIFGILYISVVSDSECFILYSRYLSTLLVLSMDPLKRF